MEHPAATVVAGAALIIRFIRSSGEERLQLKWFTTAAGLVVVTIIPLAEAPQISSHRDTSVSLVPPLKVLFCLALVCLWAATAVAILKYKLYGIDLVISKALQYGTLAVFISDHSPSFTVSDNGTGYDPSRTAMGSGQRNMADRLAALDGRLEVRSVPGQGTTITARLPLPAAAAEY